MHHAACATTADRLKPERLLVVSNRAPIEHVLDASGRLRRRAASGGLATALSASDCGVPLTWIAAAATQEDRVMAAVFGTIRCDEDCQLSYVTPSPEAYELHYGTFCNPMLWFVQHGLSDRLLPHRTPEETFRAWQGGYLPVNWAFARKVVEELAAVGSEQVMLHDYQLYLTPRFIRDLGSDAVLQHFIHIPWPEPKAWSALPPAIVTSICSGLLANDSVVFQTPRFAQNFVDTCRAFLWDVTYDATGRCTRYLGRRTRISANPISVDVESLRRDVESPEARRHFERLASEVGDRTIVRVDRLDPSKNVAAGFRAFDELLQRHPEWQRRVRFLAYLVPSRTEVPEYRACAEEVFRLIDSINARYARDGWTPISLFYEHNRLQALVALTAYDVLLVNSLNDGMNLVAKEGPVLNNRDGALVLSTDTGCFEELRDGALPVRPEDILGTAEALHQALSLPSDERRKRARMLQQAVARNDVGRWFKRQLRDLTSVERATQPPTMTLVRDTRPPVTGRVLGRTLI